MSERKNRLSVPIMKKLLCAKVDEYMAEYHYWTGGPKTEQELAEDFIAWLSIHGGKSGKTQAGG